MKTQQSIYREVQRFRQIWLWLVVLSVTGLMWYAFTAQIIFKRSFGTNPMPDLLLVVFWLIFGIGLPWAICSCKLITEVRVDGLYLQFFPFHLSFRKSPVDSLKRYQVRTYRPLPEYGGWGIRYGPKGKAYNVSGNRGVQLEFADGKKLLIGSQRPDELLDAIQVMKSTLRN